MFDIVDILPSLTIKCEGRGGYWTAETEETGITEYGDTEAEARDRVLAANRRVLEHMEGKGPKAFSAFLASRGINPYGAPVTDEDVQMLMNDEEFMAALERSRKYFEDGGKGHRIEGEEWAGFVFSPEAWEQVKTMAPGLAEREKRS